MVDSIYCFPRTRGVVSTFATWFICCQAFSPHTRGCIEPAPAGTHPFRVFPAHAGLYPSGWQTTTLAKSFPRTRGVVSREPIMSLQHGGFSPHTRGCIGSEDGEPDKVGVFPAHAGLYRTAAERKNSSSSFPRTRGVVSALKQNGVDDARFSPHTRGCISDARLDHRSYAVFPAHAGLYRMMPSFTSRCCCFPRTRGVVSACQCFFQLLPPFSPHTRGCIG